MGAHRVRGAVMADVLKQHSRRRALRSETRWRSDTSSRVQRRGGSDTSALPAGTKSVLELEDSVSCKVEAGRGRGPDDEL